MHLFSGELKKQKNGPGRSRDFKKIHEMAYVRGELTVIFPTRFTYFTSKTTPKVTEANRDNRGAKRMPIALLN